MDKRGKLVVGRREVLKGAAVLAAPISALGCSSSSDATPAATKRFAHGIASGDPLPDAVILWTRVTGDGGPVSVTWEVYDDDKGTKVVLGGVAEANADRDFCVKVDVKGLQPNRIYYYRFKALGESSEIGRTKTAPAGPTAHLRFAMVSCASYAHGYFHGYRALSEMPDLEAVLHLGDYIYEYGDSEYGDVRTYDPSHEILNLDDYRRRHAHYKKDADLQAIHKVYPFITIWDDHETANDSYKDGAENHTEGVEGAFADRKAAANRAYFEWMPIREQSPGPGGAKIFRKLAYGDLVDIVLLDTRLYARTKQAGGAVGAPPAPDPTRTLMGDEQAAWMEDQLKTSAARWKLLAQQVMVANLILEKGKQIANLDQWHGYPESRKRFLDFLKTSGVKDVVVLTGDIHSSWANELVNDPTDPAQYDPATGKGSLAVEFVTPGISSPGIPTIFLGLIDQTRPINPHIRYVEPSHRGFVILDVTKDRIQAAWHLFDDVVSPDPIKPKFSAAWSVKSGETRLVSENAPA